MNITDFELKNGTLISYDGTDEELIIPDTITCIKTGSIGAAYSYSDVKSISIPKSVTLIEPEAFCWCEHLEKLTVSTENPIYCAEDNCIIEKKSKKIVAGCNKSVIPNTEHATVIGPYAFCAMRFSEMVIPSGITTIQEGAFLHCNYLKNVIIPDTVTKIEARAFEGCYQLQSAKLPESVTFIGTDAFDCCDDNFVIITSANSYAEEYAKENGIPVALI